MSVLHIFNPETDYALAHNRPQYTPPKQVVALRAKLAALPVVWASRGDAILVVDELQPSVWLDMARDNGVDIIEMQNLRDTYDKVCPWGWNVALAHRLHKCGISAIPDEVRLGHIRRLSHRRNTLLFHNQDDAPCEFSDVDEAKIWLNSHPDAFLKAPWSSSGRGVINVASMTQRSVIGWIEGIIRQQGSILAERRWDKTIDFATEWECRDGRVDFKGFSLFKTTSEGRYLGNLSAPSDRLLECIKRYCDWDDSILERQHEVLQSHYAPYYTGPIGIDMLADTCGHINICVEVNVRRTMGMAAAALYNLTGREQLWHPLATPD